MTDDTSPSQRADETGGVWSEIYVDCVTVSPVNMSQRSGDKLISYLTSGAIIGSRQCKAVPGNDWIFDRREVWGEFPELYV